MLIPRKKWLLNAILCDFRMYFKYSQPPATTIGDVSVITNSKKSMNRYTKAKHHSINQLTVGPIHFVRYKLSGQNLRHTATTWRSWAIWFIADYKTQISSLSTLF